MSYQVLARKWRPHSFQELVGQDWVVRALTNGLDSGRLHHAYLFTGTRGVGKTTIARILAKCFNCEKGVSATPCGECLSCCEIDEGRFVDLMEVDAASRTKVEDTRELLENVQYAPTRGRYKVYIIDEVHMLSGHSFNALLKTLEEPPEHVKFLLATTDPQKLPITVLSRCLQFGLQNMPRKKIISRLAFVLKEEGIAFEESALHQLAKSADGSMRDALSLTDQAIALGGGQVVMSEVGVMLGAIDRKQVFKIVEALETKQVEKILHTVDFLAQNAPDYMGVLDEVLLLLHRIAIYQAVKQWGDEQDEYSQQLCELAERMTAEDVQLFYQVGLLAKRDLHLAPDAKSGFEMALLRMLVFRPEPAALSSDSPIDSKLPSDDLGQITEDTSMESQVNDFQSPAISESSQPENEVSFEESQSANNNGDVVSDIAQEKTIDSAQVYETVRAVDSTSNSDEVVTKALVTEQELTYVTLEALDKRKWMLISKSLMASSGVVGSLLYHCELVDSNNSIVSLRLDPNYSTLYSDFHHKAIEKILSDYFKTDLTVKVIVEKLQGESPSVRVERKASEHANAMKESLVTDERLQKVQERFSAVILEASIQSVAEKSC